MRELNVLTNYFKMHSKYDWLEVRDEGNNSSPRTNKRLCGSTTPKQITSVGNNLELRFKSDFGGYNVGYKIKAELGKYD